MARLLHELQVHQVELEMQNEELRQAQQELELSRAKYAELYDFAPVSYFAFDPDGMIREVNLAATQLLGAERARLIQTPFARFVADDQGREIFSRHLTGVRQQQAQLRCEIALSHPDGRRLYGQLQSVAVTSNTQTVLILTSVIDVTVRRQLEEQLQQAHDQLETTVEQRTAELTRSNAQLTTEIEERRKAQLALQEALQEIKQLTDRLQAENIQLQRVIARDECFGEIIGQSPAISYVFFRINQVAPQDTTVLLLGETGTGKGMVAREIHRHSVRKERPMITVNCTALPANLIESELFGREKGAFTGAHARQMGRFELADGGTIFLDEIGEMPLELQVKLLRVLQDGEFERLGSPRTLKVDVRIIAASNRNLEEEIRAGRFRQDLFYRLSVFPITIPAAAPAPGGHPAAGPLFCRQIQQENRQEDSKRVASDPGRAAELQLARQCPRTGKRHRARRHHQPGDLPRSPGPVRKLPRARGAGGPGGQSPRRPGARPHPPGGAEDQLAHRGEKRGGRPARPQPQHPARPHAQIRHPPTLVSRAANPIL